MSQITFQDWKAGLDVRQGENVADANRLRICQNAYITTGKNPRKRPPLVVVDNLPAESHGLAEMDGKLHVFYDKQHSAPVVPDGVVAHGLSSITGNSDVVAIHYAEHFNGFLYVVAEYADGSIQHHYIDDEADTRVTDQNCPQTKLVKKKSSRLYSASAGAGDVVRYCAGANPRNWTPEAEPTSLSAGFLPVNIQADGSDKVVALGSYHNMLVAFTSDHAQLWHVDADQTTNSFREIVYSGAKSSAIDGMVGDLFFLSSQGVRSITTQANSDNIYDNDIGTAIDRLITAESGEAGAKHIRKFGQYWIWFDYTYDNEQGEEVSGTKVYVFSHSRTSKVSAWSTYILPARIDYITEAFDSVYIRSGDQLLKMDPNAGIYKDFGSVGTEEGENIEVLVSPPFLDFKAPGVIKQITAADFVVRGTAEFSLMFDPENTDLKTMWQTISGDSRAGPLTPVELMSTSVAPVVRHRANEDFWLDAMTFHYFKLGAL